MVILFENYFYCLYTDFRNVEEAPFLKAISYANYTRNYANLNCLLTFQIRFAFLRSVLRLKFKLQTFFKHKYENKVQ